MKQFWYRYGYLITCFVVLFLSIMLAFMPRWMLIITGFMLGGWLTWQLSIKKLKNGLHERLDEELAQSRRDRLMPGAEDQIALFQVRDREGKLFLTGDIKDTLTADQMMKLALWIYGLSRDIQQKAYDLRSHEERDDKAEKSPLN